MKHRGQHAIVIGASMGGLLAARAALEGHVRRRLQELSNVRVIENCAVPSAR
jgi:alpha-beta hydrolase superfamily lysophospholipase